MRKLKCSKDCGCECFTVSVTTDAYKQPIGNVERVSSENFTCFRCGAKAKEEEVT